MSNDRTLIIPKSFFLIVSALIIMNCMITISSFKTYAATREDAANTALAEVGNSNYTKYNGHTGNWCADFYNWVMSQIDT